MNVSESKRYPRVGIVTAPLFKSGIAPLSNLIQIITHFSNKVPVITGNEFPQKNIFDEKIQVFFIEFNYSFDGFRRILNPFILNIKVSYYLLKVARNVDCLIFFFGDYLLLPILISKILNKKVLLQLSARPVFYLETQKISFLSRINSVIITAGQLLTDKILIYSPSLICEWNLEQHKQKIVVCRRHFLNFELFRPTQNYHERPNIIGYVGRLSDEKGILNLVKAIPEILKQNQNLEFLIIGDGRLKQSINKYIDENNLSNKVKLLGWVPHNNLPEYLNKLKLLVIPSYDEGLPNNMLESMSCGTPVLATPVGAIKDFVIDEETGFIMKNNSPECIATNVSRALEFPNIDKVVVNSRDLVKREFSYENTIISYRNILMNI